MFALLPRFLALATELDDLCRHTLASFLLALDLNVERTKRNWKITLNGEVASIKKFTRVGFTNLLARPGFTTDRLKPKQIDILGGRCFLFFRKSVRCLCALHRFSGRF